MTERYEPEEELDVSEQVIKSVKDITGASTYDITEQLIVDGGRLREQVREGARVWLEYPDGRRIEFQLRPIEPDPLSNLIHFPKRPQNYPQDGE